MNLREIAALGDMVAGLVGDNAVLYLWATTPHLPGAINTLGAWGFNYKSLHVWHKSKIACGFWCRSDAEILLIGERGAPAAPDRSKLLPTVFHGDAFSNAHSSKPRRVHVLIEDLWPGARMIELFARSTRPGWECYGSELGHYIYPEGITRWPEQRKTS